MSFQDDLRLAASNMKMVLHRNNVGMLRDRRGQYVRYGLCVGSSDLIGWKSMLVTPHMVGKYVAVFTAIEVKVLPDHATQQQVAFIEAVRAAGGIAIVAYTEEDLSRAIQEWRERT